MTWQTTGRFKPNITVDQQLRRLAAALSSERGLRLEMLGPDTLVVIRRYRPSWATTAAIVGLLFFLLGLLFLLVKRDERTTVIGEDVPGGSRWTLVGDADARILQILKREQLVDNVSGASDSGYVLTLRRLAILACSFSVLMIAVLLLSSART